MKTRVAVMFGGASPEHEVSIITGIQTMKAMGDRFDIIPIYVAKSGRLYTGEHLRSITTYQNLPLLEKMSQNIALPSNPGELALSPAHPTLFRNNHTPFDVIFPCFHGGVGEGGWVQGLAEFYRVPLVGTGITGAAIGMDKVAMKAAFDGANVQQAPYIWFYRSDWYKKQATFVTEITSHLKYPIFVKPSRGGSSIGTTCAKTKQELIRAIDLASAMDNRIVVEEGITGAREINISIMGNAGDELECSVCEEVFHEGSEFLDFKDKYLANGSSEGMASTDRIIPAKINKSLSNKIEVIGKLIFNLFDCSGLVRLDFLVKDKDIYCIEINTIPGSLSFYLWEKSGYTFPRLVDRLIALSLIKNKDVSQNVIDYSSPILSDLSSSGKLGKKLSS
jgi:D-alanine-D-alanine ligase